jgi:hypothetical protein
VFYTLSIIIRNIWFWGFFVCVYKLSNPFVLGNAMCYVTNSWYILQYKLQVYVLQVRCLFASGHEMKAKFHLAPACKQTTNLYDIHVKLCVQSWTPDDGRKDRPKHVEWYLINSKVVHLVGFTIEIYHDPMNVKHTILHINSPYGSWRFFIRF